MRFRGERSLEASPDEVWSALHDPDVLRRIIPGCQRLRAVGPDCYDAALGVHVGPLSDTYRGRFDIHGHASAGSLRVHVEGRGRAGRLELDLRVDLAPAASRATSLRYDASAQVGGLVARLGSPTLTVAGAHLTGVFFGGLDRTLRARAASHHGTGQSLVSV
jgi:carbon monoxide dehydrogenase subunit G